MRYERRERGARNIGDNPQGVEVGHGLEAESDLSKVRLRQEFGVDNLDGLYEGAEE